VQPQFVYPLRFEPIFQPRIWGGRRLANLFQQPLPGSDPIGEAWVLSDRDDFPSRIAEGSLKGQTLHEVLTTHRNEILGRQAERFPRFPLLLKFLDARETLSVQVHPSDRHSALLPSGERGKTEAWVVLQAEPQSRIYAGLKPGTTCEQLRAALDAGKVADHLASFTPKPGDGVFLEAGTVHALGGGVVLFEVQQNSDVTFRLYDWDRVDAKTGKPRQLHIDQALSCIDFSRGPVNPVTPAAVNPLTGIPLVRTEGENIFVECAPPEEKLAKQLEEIRAAISDLQLMDSKRYFDCEFFRVTRRSFQQAGIMVPKSDSCRAWVCIAGEGELTYNRGSTPVRSGDVVLLPAALDRSICVTESSLTVLEIALPE
jgi:mannose-6-phosphate isomerase